MGERRPKGERFSPFGFPLSGGWNPAGEGAFFCLACGPLPERRPKARPPAGRAIQGGGTLWGGRFLKRPYERTLRISQPQRLPWENLLGSAETANRRGLSQNQISAAGLFSCSDREHKQRMCGKVLFWGTAKLTLSQKQDQMWIIFFSELAMRSEFQKDGSSSGRFSVSSKAFSD